MTQHYEALTQSFEACDLDPAAFGHQEHVGVAYEMLRKYDFLTAAAKYADSIRTIATKAGAPEKYNATITLAFLSLIAERMQTCRHDDCDDFLAQNQDLMSKDFLLQRYSAERLQSDLARHVFLMPDATR